AGRTGEILDSLFAYAEWDEALIYTVRSNNNIYFGFKMLDESYSNEILPFAERIPNRSKDSLRANTGILDKADFLAPPMRWLLASNGMGYMEVIYDKGGVVRKVPLIALCKGNFYTSLSLTLLQAVEGREDIDLPRSRVLTQEIGELGKIRTHSLDVGYELIGQPGNRDAKHIQLVPMNEVEKKINRPFVGLKRNAVRAQRRYS
ncbi:unnamed protein product, partial [marine sediment metagenome]